MFDRNRFLPANAKRRASARALTSGCFALGATLIAQSDVAAQPNRSPFNEPGLRGVGSVTQVPQPSRIPMPEVSAGEFERMREARDQTPPPSVLVTAAGRTYRQERGRAPRSDLPQRLANVFRMAEVEGPYRQVLGGDSRNRVAASSLDNYPFRTIGRLGSCTGVLIGPRHVLTAAHCLHDDEGKWYWPLYFRPGVDGTTAINGSARAAVARRAYVGYKNNRSWDIGLVILEDEARTAALGRLGFWYYGTSSYSDKKIYNFGYPTAGQQCPGQLCGGHMWGMGCKIAAGSSGQVTHNCDTSGGHSGSPVYEIVNGRRRVLGVHWGKPHGQFNAAARIRPVVAEDLCTWMSWWPGTHGNMPSCAQ